MRIENPRLDIASRERMERSRLFRLVVDADGEIHFDKEGRLPGRGIYIEKSLQALETALKKHRFDRFGRISEETIQVLREEIQDE